MKWSRKATQETIGSDDFPHAPTPSALKTQLAVCAEEGPFELSSQIVDTLERLPGSSLTAVQRFRLIELCSNAASHLQSDLNGSLAGCGLPLPSDKIKLLSRCAETYWLIAQCYKNVTEQFVSRGDHHLRDATYLLRACYRGLTNLVEYVLVDYERYAKVRKGVWLDIHKFYCVALSEGLHDVQVDVREVRSFQTVEHVYKKVLLLGLSDPFRHPPRGLMQIYSRLDGWARLASLTTTPPDSGRCSFTVNPELDRPAMPTLPQTTIRPQLNERYLITRDLVDRLKMQHRRAARMIWKRVERSDGITKELGSIELLRRLIVNWGLHPIRNAARTRTSKSCDVVVGVKSVCTVLNGFKPLVGKETGTSGKWISTMKRALTRPLLGSDDFLWIVNTWSIEDESEWGWRVCAAANITANHLRIGELVAIRTGYDWPIGSVRWAQSDGDNNLFLGIKKIKGSAHPALTCRLQTDNPRSRELHPALLLVDESDAGRTFSLLCDKRLYLPMGAYFVQLVGQKDRRAFESTDVRLSTRSFVWFEVRESEAEVYSSRAN